MSADVLRSTSFEEGPWEGTGNERLRGHLCSCLRGGTASIERDLCLRAPTADGDTAGGGSDGQFVTYNVTPLMHKKAAEVGEEGPAQQVRTVTDPAFEYLGWAPRIER